MTNPLKDYFKLKTCKRCIKAFTPTTGTQIYCIDCIPQINKDRKQKWAREHKELLTTQRRKEISSRTTAHRKYKRLGIPRICVSCNQPKIKLDVHHKDLNTFNNSLANLEYRCKPCHRELHIAIRLVQATT